MPAHQRRAHIAGLAASGDLAAMTTSGWRAFADDPVVRWCFPDDDDYTANGRGMFEWILVRGLARGTLWCTPDGVGYANWIAPGRPEAFVDESDDGATEAAPLWRLERYGAIDAAFTANTPPEPHWYLAMLATHPDWQRRGVGAALMAPAIAEADAHGLGCYLETESEANVAYYRRHGFEVRSEWDLTVAGERPDAHGPHMWGMWRDPR